MSNQEQTTSNNTSVPPLVKPTSNPNDLFYVPPLDDNKYGKGQQNSQKFEKVQRKSHKSSEQSEESKNRNRRDQGRKIKKERRRSKSRSRDNSRHRHRNYSRSGNDNKELTYYKTKLCPLYQNGQCQKGSKCNYAHGQHQLKELPNFKKTKLCIAYNQGKCPYNSWDCKYAHGQTQLKKNISDQKRENQSIMSKYKFQTYPAQNVNYPYMVNTPPTNPYLIPNYPPGYTIPHTVHPGYQSRPIIPSYNWPYPNSSVPPNVPPPNTQMGISSQPILNHPPYDSLPFRTNWQSGNGSNPYNSSTGASNTNSSNPYGSYPYAQQTKPNPFQN